MERKSEPLLERRESWPKRSIPAGVRFITAAIDVQISRFVVQVWGWGAGLEQWCIDRFDLKYSPRGKDVRIDPAAYIEDWSILLPYVIDRRYPLADDSGRDMGVLLSVCDSGGAPGVTDRAYAFEKLVRKQKKSDRFLLVKGATSQTGANARVKLTWPEQSSQRHANKLRARGATPLLLINTNQVKDTCYADLARTSPGGGFVHFPIWLGAEFFAEMTAEEKDLKGNWINIGDRRNESWDLMVYNRAAAIHRGVEKVNWDNPMQGWAKEWDANSEVATVIDGGNDLFMPSSEPAPPSLAEAVNPSPAPRPPPQPARRRPGGWVSSGGRRWM